MGGLAVLLIFGLYVAVAFKVTSLVKSRRDKALVLLAFVLIPTADAVYGRIKLRQMCAAEGGLHIYSKPTGRRGFFYKGEPREEWVTKYKFEFVEGEALIDKRITNARIEKNNNNAITRLVDIPLISKYQLEIRNTPDIQKNYDQLKYSKWLRTDIVVLDRSTQKILGQITDFNFSGGWVEQAIAAIYASRGNAGTCDIAKDAWEYSHLDAKLVTTFFEMDFQE